MQSDIKSKIGAFITNYFVKDSGLVLEDDTSLLEEGIIDSVGVLELVAFLEETFSFRVEDEEIVPENLDSVNKLVTYVQLKLTKNNLAVASSDLYFVVALLMLSTMCLILILLAAFVYTDSQISKTVELSSCILMLNGSKIAS